MKSPLLAPLAAVVLAAAAHAQIPLPQPLGATPVAVIVKVSREIAIVLYWEFAF